MDAVMSVERESTKVLDLFNELQSSTENHITESENLLRETIKQLQSGAPKPTQIHDTLKSVKYSCSKVTSDHRELHSSVSKIGKAIDRSFTSDYDSTSREHVFASEECQNAITDVILQHFYRQGLNDISDTLTEEAGFKPDNMKENFIELNTILAAIKKRDLEPALEWIAVHSLDLCPYYIAPKSPEENSNQNYIKMAPMRMSTLEVKLHRLYFIEMLRNCGKDGSDHSEDRRKALQYAKTHFPRLITGHESEFASLMGAMMYAGRIAQSPYSHLLSPMLWDEVELLFEKSACALMGLSVESPLITVINAGCTALPALLNIKQVMRQRLVGGVWGPRDELPIEIDLGADCRFHSVFACPILKQQTTDQNPPMRLLCGHCISKDALSKLSSSSNHKVKCPYCPVEQNPAEARRLYF